MSNKVRPNEVRVRFAPSPTGYLHVGGARTALFNWLYAHHTSGKFLLRIEDTDQARSTEDFLQSQLEDLKWLGLHWDNSNLQQDNSETQRDWKKQAEANSHCIYRQSQNLDTYKNYGEKLLESGHAFYCFCREDQLLRKKQKAKEQGQFLHYDGTCRQFSLKEAKAKVQSGESATIRFKVPATSKDYLIKDLIRGDVTFPSNMVGDFVILRSNGMPVYNFCCVIDDHLMNITHVFRSEEHLSNTLRQAMIYEGYGWERPQFVHLSLILGSDKKKLSKRHGGTSCHHYRERGFLPEALLNYLALLGWSLSDDREIFSLPELIKLFTLDRVHKNPAIFDEDKLKAINAHHLRHLPHKDLWQRILPFLERAGLHIQQDQGWKHQSLEVLKSYMETLADAPALYQLLLDDHFQITDAGFETLKWPEAKKVIAAWQNQLKAFNRDLVYSEDFLHIQKQIQTQCGVKGKHLFMPLRVAILGRPQGVELKKFVPLLKVSSLLKRSEEVLKHC